MPDKTHFTHCTFGRNEIQLQIDFALVLRCKSSKGNFQIKNLLS